MGIKRLRDHKTTPLIIVERFQSTRNIAYIIVFILVRHSQVLHSQSADAYRLSACQRQARRAKSVIHTS